MQALLNFLETEAKRDSESELYSQVLKFLVQEGFLEVIDTEDCFDFHSKIFQLAGLKHGVGLSVALIAQVNMVAGLLKLNKKNYPQTTEYFLKQIQQGESTIAFGVSEKNWKGQIKNLNTKLEYKEGKNFLTGSKSFLTNGTHSKYFLILAKDSQDYSLVILPSSSVKLYPFQLDFAKEATHASIEFTEVEVNPNWIFKCNYLKFAERLRISEIFSLNYVFNGYIQSILPSLVKQAKEKHTWQNKSEAFEKIFNFHLQLEMQKSYLEKISKERNQKMLEYPIEKKFPFGLEFLVPMFIHTFEPWFSKAELISMYPDLELFFYQDNLTQFFLKKSVHNFMNYLLY